MLLQSFLSFALLSSTLASVLVPREPLSVNPPLSAVQHADRRSVVEVESLDARGIAPVVVRVTNAQRMIAGLPPLPPRRRGTRTSLAARSQPSSTGPTYGYIAAKFADTDSSYGYVRRDMDGLTSFTSGALRVILPSSSDRTPPFNLEVDPLMSGHTYFALIASTGSVDVTTGNTNYVEFGRVEGSEPNAVADNHPNSRSDVTGTDYPIESPIWSYDETTGRLTATWMNDDFSRPTLYLGFLNSDSKLIATANKAGFEGVYGSDSINWVDFYFSPEITGQ